MTGKVVNGMRMLPTHATLRGDDAAWRFVRK